MGLILIVLITWAVVSLACAFLVGPLLRGFTRLSFRADPRPGVQPVASRPWRPVTI